MTTHEFQLTPQLSLRPIEEYEFQSFLNFFTPLYADTLLKADIISHISQAGPIMQRDLAGLFPKGFRTSDQHVYYAYFDKKYAGLLWLGDRAYHSTPFEQAWVYYIDVDPNFRNQGIGTALLHWSEQHYAAKKTPRLGLNVFHHNPDAKRLYERLGYTTYLQCTHPLESSRIYRYEMNKLL